MFSVTITPDFGGSGSELEKLVARAIGSNPAAAAAYAKQTKGFIDKAKTGALRITAARLRKRILEAYTENSLNWPKHSVYTGNSIMGPVVTAHLARANRPHAVISAGKKAKSTMSNKQLVALERTVVRAAKGSSSAAKKLGILQEPKPYPLGGRLPKAIRYKITNDNLTVGILPNSAQIKQKQMRQFQDGSSHQPDERERRYLAALGIFIRRGTVLRNPMRQLFAPIQEKYPPDKLFESAFIDILTGKLEARD